MSQISDFEKQISKMKNEIADEINFEIEKKLGITVYPKEIRGGKVLSPAVYDDDNQD